jgi:phenylacetate-CoA ligase
MSYRFSSRSELEAHQLARLQALLATVIPANPFYAAKLASLPRGWAPGSLEEFATRISFTTKEELSADQLAHPPYGSNLTFPIERYTRCHQTSGSSGQPLRWLDTNESWSGLLDQWGDIYQEAGVTPADHLFFAFSFGPFLGFWTAFEAALRIGCLCIPGGGMSSATRLRAMIANGATVLCCTPTYALRLAEVSRIEEMDLMNSKVKLIIVAGEPGGSVPATREAISSAWKGARVFDHHGMTEVGPVSHECFKQPGCLRLLEWAYLPEIIDPDSGRPAGPGQPGELVLTTLNRSASPLIRYRTGDLVQPRPLDLNPPGVIDRCVEGGILGRVDDMVQIRGVNVYPSAVEEIIRECGDVLEYQVNLRPDRALVEMEVVIESPGFDRLQARLEKLLQQRLAIRVPVRVVPPGTLPRFEMKARRWVRHPAAPAVTPTEPAR